MFVASGLFSARASRSGGHTHGRIARARFFVSCTRTVIAGPARVVARGVGYAMMLVAHRQAKSLLLLLLLNTMATDIIRGSLLGTLLLVSCGGQTRFRCPQ